MKEQDFIKWATEQVGSLDPEKLRFARIPEPPKVSPVYGDAEFEMAMISVPQVSSQRIANFRAAKFIVESGGEKSVVWKWVFDAISRI